MAESKVTVSQTPLGIDEVLSMDLDSLLTLYPYCLNQKDKEILLCRRLSHLCRHHRENCGDYKKIFDLAFPDFQEAERLTEIPYLPVGLFKRHQLMSIAPNDVFQVLTSSGTTAQIPSRIFLDSQTARRQTLALAAIMKTVLGKNRLPMVILDAKDVLARRTQLSAQATAILGMMNFGRDHFFAFDSEMRLDEKGLDEYLQKYKSQDIFFFGLTYIVWRHFYQAIKDKKLDLSRGVLVHSGGWKRLVEESVSPVVFKESFKQATGLCSVFNFYGMIEQVGSIFLEDNDGFFCPPLFADVIIRNPKTWRECQPGEAGVVQVLSALPTSYPGHSLLTEDLGVVHDVDEPGKHKGKRFSILGRLPKSELRGCSDVRAYAG